jgi:biopolymer transport protein ExbB
LEQIGSVWRQALEIWASGGWAMWAIAAIALTIFGIGMHVRLELRERGFLSVAEKTWRRWIDHPEERRGAIGQMLDAVSGAASVKETAARFQQLRASETHPFERDLKVMKICVSAAPLVGLLGTVTGMLATFGALSMGSGGEKTMAMIAEGISEALVTTETGLVIALPGLFFQYQLSRTFERYQAFLAHLEAVCSQAVYRRMRREQAAAPGRVPASAAEVQEAVA